MPQGISCGIAEEALQLPGHPVLHARDMCWIDRRRSASLTAVLILLPSLIPPLAPIDKSKPIDHDGSDRGAIATFVVSAAPTPTDQDVDPL